MRNYSVLPVVLMGLSSFVSADGVSECHHSQCNKPRLAIQGAIATGGNLGIGVVEFTPQTELGVTLSGSYNNAFYQTGTITPVLFGGFRKALGEQTYFAYGIDTAATFGQIEGVHINSNYQIGPYISLEQMLTCHIMLAGWIQPYQYSSLNLGGISTSTNSFFASGGVAINYLF